MGEKHAWRMRLVVMGLASIAAVSFAGAQTLPTRPRMPSTIPASALPTLGVNAEGRWVGPDQRIWYYRQFLKPIHLEEVKQEIVEQFARQEPILTRSSVALFEPQGRVWFTAQVLAEPKGREPFQGMLLGYDGKNWIEHRTDYPVPDRPDWSVGGAGNNVLVNGRAFFAMANEIHEFDGLAWRAHVVLEVDPFLRRNVTMLLMPEPDGKGLLVTTGQRQQRRLLRWNGTEFRELPLPPVQTPILNVAAGAKGVWLMTQASLMLLPYDGGAPVVQAMQGVRLGEYSAIRLVQMHSDYTGRTYFLLAGMGRGGEGTNGILMEDRDGQFLPLRHPAASARCVPTSYVNPNAVIPVAGTGGELVWLPGNGTTVGPLLLDTRRGQVLHECPDTSAILLLGATRDGLLLGGGPPYSIMAKPLPQRPAGLLPEGSGWATITTSGQLVANVAGKLSILENGQWRTLLAEPGLNMSYCRGEGDALLLMYARNGDPILGPPRVAMVADGKAVEASSLPELLEANGAMFAKWFGNRLLMGEGLRGGLLTMCVNGAGDVFQAAAPEYRLRILHQGKWIDPGDDLRKIGMPAVGIKVLAPVGDGSAVYVSAWDGDMMGGSSAWARWKDGKVVFEAAPPIMGGRIALDGISQLRDAQGGLWMMRGDMVIDNVASFPCIVRMTQSGVTEYPKIVAGEPLLVDSHQCLLMSTEEHGTSGVYVAREGKMTTPAMPIARAGGISRKALEVRPGLIWIAAGVGIYELQEVEAGSGRYTLRELFRPALDVWTPQSMTLLSDGRIAIRGMKDRLSGEWRLYALPAPGR